MPCGVGDKVKMGNRKGVVTGIKGEGNSLAVRFEDGHDSEVAYTVLVEDK